jgi:radical SAM protein with 4Fe4S-binding SPASM domain
MELSLFRKIVNELPDRIFVQLFFGGESLMHPEIVPMISFLHQHKPKVQVRIATNGTLLDTDLARDLILSGLDYISFSFDGPDRETYESIRRGAKYEETLENILNFTRLRRELDSKTPQVNVEIISMKATEAKLEQFIQYFKRLPIDAIFVKRFSHWAGLIERDADDGDSTSRVVCPVPWNDLGILWDGTVVPCCTDYNARYPVGNVSNDRLADLWNNDRMKALRRSLASYHYYEIPLCAHCKDIEAITSAHSRSITPASTG